MSDIIALGIGLLLLVGCIVGYTLNKKHKEEAKKVGASSSSYGSVIHGIPHISPHNLLQLFVIDEKLVIKDKEANFEVPLSRMQAAMAVSKTDLLKKDKSVLARGIIGNVLLGPLGAIVGGMSGIGQKHIKGSFLVINYKTKDSDTTEVLIFDMIKMEFAKKVATDISKKIMNQKTVNGVVEL